MNPSDEDPQALLSEQSQWTEPWGGSDDGEPCNKCGGRGETEHRCWSCLLTGASPDCPVCQGKVRWGAQCPVCRGTGEIDGAPRRGVSVLPTVEGLYHYMLDRDADLAGCVILALEADRAPDEDFDADEGAILVLPRAILACEPVDRRLADEIKRRTGELSR